MTQKATVERMLDEAGMAGVRSDQFLHVNIPRAAARIEEIKKRLEAEGVGTITSTPEKQFCRYRKVMGVGVGAGVIADGVGNPDEPALPYQGSRLAGTTGSRAESLSVDPGEGSPATEDDRASLPGSASAQAVVGQPAPLFQFTERPLSAFTDQEAA